MFIRSLVVVAIVVLSSLSLVSLSGSDTEGGCQVSDDSEPWLIRWSPVEEGSEHDLGVYGDASSVMISSDPDINGMTFNFLTEASNDLRVSAQFQSWNGDRPRTVSIEVWFLALVEFKDVDGDGAFDRESDETVSVYPLSMSTLNSDLLNWNMGNQSTDLNDLLFKNFAHLWNEQLMEFYQKGFLYGWDIGFTAGKSDSLNGTAFNPDPDLFIRSIEMKEKIYGVLQEYIISCGETDPHVIDALNESYWDGVSNGFWMGYQRGFGSEGNGSMDEADPYDYLENDSVFNDYFPTYWGFPGFDSPIYDPPDVFRVVGADGSEKIVIIIWDKDGVLGIRCTVSDRVIHTEEGVLVPSEMKIDIMVRNYPFRM